LAFAQVRPATPRPLPTATKEAVCDKPPPAARENLPRVVVNKVVTAGKPEMAQMASNDMTQPSASFVYTLDNDAARNSVAVYRRGNDGSLMPLAGSPFNAGGKGLTGGDIDEQGAIRVTGKFVLVVNPGSDSIAVFEKTPRGLLHVEGSPFASHGNTPLSLAVHGDLVYVANQAADFANPTSLPNITGFRLSSSGRLTHIPSSTVQLPKGMGPAQVEFSSNGKVLVVSAGFQVDGGEGSRIYSFQVMKDGMLQAGENSPLKPMGAVGTVGFSISPAGNRVFVSTFKESGVVTFDIDPQTAAIKQVHKFVSNDQRAACWTAISKDGKTLYVGNFVSNSISVYDVAQDGALTLLGSIPRRGATNRDTKDIELSSDGHYLYAVGSGEKQISVFKVEANRLLTELPMGKSPVMLTTGQNITGLVAE
jgi:6-phosphogluconolactonase (cycloisomerase 2 family)